MRKEIFYAIFAGGILGLVIAFGVWRTNQALKPASDSTNASQSPTPGATVANSTSGLTLASPQNDDIITENPVVISGVTASETFVTISTEEDDYVVRSEKDGSFEAEVELAGGVNQVIVNAFNSDGSSHTQNLTLVYSTEFEQ